jgi:hypothetical protein
MVSRKNIANSGRWRSSRDVISVSNGTKGGN